MTRPAGRRHCHIAIAIVTALVIVAASLSALLSPREAAAADCDRIAATVAVCRFYPSSSTLVNPLTSIAITLGGSAHETLTSRDHWHQIGTAGGVFALVKGLDPGTAYTAGGTAYWSGGSKTLRSYFISKLPTSVPPAVFGVRVDDAGTGDRVTWDSPAGLYSEIEIERETLVDLPSGASFWSNGVVFTHTPSLAYLLDVVRTGTSSSYTYSADLYITGSTRVYTDATVLDSGIYRYRVRAVDGDIGGPWSSWRVRIGSEAAQTVSPAPLNVEVTRTADWTAAILTWDAVPQDVTEYVIRRQNMVVRDDFIFGEGTRTFTVAASTGDATGDYTDSGIDGDTTYQYEVAAKVAAGQGPFSEPVLTAGRQDPTSSVDRSGVFTSPNLEGFSPVVDEDAAPTAHEIAIAAPSSAWPIRVEAMATEAILLSGDGTATGCANLESSLVVTRGAPTFWLYACEADKLTTIQLRRDGDRSLLAEYRIHTKSPRTPPPTPPSPGAIGTPSSDDPLSIEPIIDEVMRNSGIGYDMGALKHFLVIAGAVGMAAVPLLAGGRGPSNIVIAFLVFNIGLWLGALWMGFPWYWALIPTALTVGLGIMAGARSVAGVGVGR